MDWVDSELRGVVERVRESLSGFAANTNDLTQLRVAGTQVRHVAGTLAMTELTASASIAEEIERTLSYCVDNSDGKRASSLSELLNRALGILAGRIDAVRKFDADEVVSTIAIINELRAGRKSEMIDIATVFSPNVYAPLPASIEEQPVENVDTSVERRQFQENLLAWVNNPSDGARLEAMAAVCARLRVGAGAESWQRLWWVAEAFAETRQLYSNLTDRSSLALFRRLDQHIRRFDEAGSAGAIDDDLLLHLLFAIAQVDSVDASAVASHVIETFDLQAAQHEPSTGDDAVGATPIAAEHETARPTGQGASTLSSARRDAIDAAASVGMTTHDTSIRMQESAGALMAPAVQSERAFADDALAKESIADARATPAESTGTVVANTLGFEGDSSSQLHLPERDADAKSVATTTIDTVRAVKIPLCALLDGGSEDGSLITDRLDEIVARLDVEGHTNASDVVDLTRRVIDSVVAGRLQTSDRLADFAKTGIDAVERHLAAVAGAGVLDPDLLTAAQTALSTGLAESRASELPLATMRRNLTDYFDDWRRRDANRDDWRNLRVSIDDIAAFAKHHENDELRQAALSLSTILSNLIARLSKPGPSDVAELDQAMERILIELATVIDDPAALDDLALKKSRDSSQKDIESGANGGLSGIGNVGASKGIGNVGVVASSVRLGSLDKSSTTPSSSFVGERTALLKVLRQIQERLPELIASPKSKELQSELPLGLLLVKEKAERNGLGSVADIARIGEHLAHDVANGIVPMSKAVAQFVSLACDRIDALVHVDPPTSAKSNIEAWRLGAACARQGKDPSLALGAELTSLVERPSADARTERTTKIPRTTATDGVDPDSLKPIGSTATRPAVPSEQAGRARTPGSKSPTATTAGSLVQQVLRTSGMAEELDAESVRASKRPSRAASGDQADSEPGAHESSLSDRDGRIAALIAPAQGAVNDGVGGVQAKPTPSTETFVGKLSAPLPTNEGARADSEFDADVDYEQVADKTSNVPSLDSALALTAGVAVAASTTNDTPGTTAAGPALLDAGGDVREDPASAGPLDSSALVDAPALLDAGGDVPEEAASTEPHDPSALGDGPEPLKAGGGDREKTASAGPIAPSTFAVEPEALEGAADREPPAAGAIKLPTADTLFAKADTDTRVKGADTDSTKDVETKDVEESRTEVTQSASRTAHSVQNPVGSENVDVLIGEAIAHTASIGQWIEQGESNAVTREVDDDIASTVNVLRTLTRVIGVDSLASVYEPLNQMLEQTRNSALSLNDAKVDFIKRARRLTDSALLNLADGKAVTRAQEKKLDELVGEVQAYLLQERPAVSVREANENDQIPVMIVGDDIVTLEQLAGGQSSDQLDLDRLFIEESSDIFRRIREATARWRDENFARHARSDLLHEFHTLKGNARTACFPEASALAHSLETLVGQQNQQANEGGLHGEEVVIYLNKAATVLSEFIQHPDSDESRRNVEALKRQVDAQCVTESRIAEEHRESNVLNTDHTNSAKSKKPDEVDESARIDEIKPSVPPVAVVSPVGQMRDLATVAATTYAYDGFQQSTEDAASTPDPETTAQATATPRARARVPTPPVVAQTADERTLPSSLMAPAMLITETEIALTARRKSDSAFADIRNTLDRAGAMPNPPVDLVEKAADRLAAMQTWTNTLAEDLARLSAARDDLDAGVNRVQDRVRELHVQNLAQASTDAGMRPQFDEIRIELAELRRGLRKFATTAADTRELVARHGDGLSTLTQEVNGIRRVAFETVAPRLRLVVRQSASQMKKETRFVLQGGEIVVDRHVLDCLLGPIENLLRNAVVHGIEASDIREKAQKSVAGTVQLALRQSDNQLVIEVSDDGAGIDYVALARSIETAERQHAGTTSQAADHTVAQSELTERMFDVGISTAAMPTELAGRGVGLDVVRKVARLLNGRVDVTSEAGRGSSFKIRVPADAESVMAKIISMDDCVVALPAFAVLSEKTVREVELESMLTADTDSIYLAGRRYPYLDLNRELGLDWEPSDATEEATNLLLLRLTRIDVVVKASGPCETAFVVRHSRPTHGHEVALVPSTFAAVQWLDPNALWSKKVPEKEAVDGPYQAGGGQRRGDLRVAGTKPRRPVGPSSSHRNAELHVLFVADNRDVAPALVSALQANDASVHVSESSKKASERIALEPVSVVIVDLDIPDGEAFGLLDQLEKMDPTSRPACIVVSSAATDPDLRQRLKALDIQRVIDKPCDNDELATMIFNITETSTNQR